MVSCFLYIFILFIILKVIKYENIQIMMIFYLFFIKAGSYQKWTFLKMSNSKKNAKSFFPIFYHFFLVFYFITINHNKIKNRDFSLFKERNWRKREKLKKKRETEEKERNSIFQNTHTQIFYNKLQFFAGFISF